MRSRLGARYSATSSNHLRKQDSNFSSLVALTFLVEFDFIIIDIIWLLTCQIFLLNLSKKWLYIYINNDFGYIWSNSCYIEQLLMPVFEYPKKCDMKYCSNFQRKYNRKKKKKNEHGKIKRKKIWRKSKRKRVSYFNIWIFVLTFCFKWHQNLLVVVR